MPFTISHAAAVLPLGRVSRYRLPLSAMAIGSMTPDFGYFAYFGTLSWVSHDLRGIIPFCVPVGLAAYLLLHLVMSRPVLALLPQPVTDRIVPALPCRADLSLAWFVLLLFAFAAGALTHLGWDALTHSGSFITDNVEFLRTPLPLPTWPNLRLYKVLQHLSSVLGLLVLGLSFRAWLRRTPRPPHSTLPVLGLPAALAVLAAIAVVGCAGAWFGWSRAIPWTTIERSTFYAVTGGIRAGGLALLGYCLAWHAWTFGARRPMLSK